MAAAWLREEGEAGPLGTQMYRPRPAIMPLSGNPGPCCFCSSRAQAHSSTCTSTKRPRVAHRGSQGRVTDE